MPYDPARVIAPEPAGDIVTASKILAWLNVPKSTLKLIFRAGLLIGPHGRYKKSSVKLAMLQGFKPDEPPFVYLGTSDPTTDDNLITVDQAVEEFSLTRRDHLYRILSTGLLEWEDCTDGISRVRRDDLATFHSELITLARAKGLGITSSELRKLDKWKGDKLTVVRVKDVQAILANRPTEQPPPDGWVSTKVALALLKVKTRGALEYHGVRRHRYKGKTYWCQDDVLAALTRVEPLRKLKRRRPETRLEAGRKWNRERMMKVNRARGVKPRKRRMTPKRGNPDFISERWARQIGHYKRHRLKKKVLQQLDAAGVRTPPST
jgi:hypothetical protein